MKTIIIVFIVVVILSSFIIALYLAYFGKEHFRIVKVEYRNGNEDYAIESSTFFGLPGTWSTKTISTGFTLVFLDGFTLEEAKKRLESLKEEQKESLGKKIKNKTVIEKWK